MRAKRLGCVFTAKKLSPLEMSAGYGRCQGSCLQLPRFFANATQVFLYRASGRCKQLYVFSVNSEVENSCSCSSSSSFSRWPISRPSLEQRNKIVAGKSGSFGGAEVH